MNCEQQQLELTWADTGKGRGVEPRMRLVEPGLAAGYAPRALEAVMAVCGGPRCPCLNIHFHWQPSQVGEPATTSVPRDFWLDLNDLKVVTTPDLDQSAESRALAERVGASLTPSDQQRLREWYLAAKLELIEGTPISHIDIDGLPNADDGAMIGFVEVFPCGGLALNFSFGNETWAVDEQYCVQTGCRCTETVLMFLRLKDGSGRVIKDFRNLPALRYNYVSGKTQTLKQVAENPSPEALLAVLKREPTLNLQLEKRHLILRCLYARHEQARSKARVQNLERLAARASPKIGRNDPCPCGSGRKFKHCCLNKAPL